MVYLIFFLKTYIMGTRTNENPQSMLGSKIKKNITTFETCHFLWDIGKQNSPRCDAADCGVPSGAILFAYRNFIENEIKIKKNTPDVPKNDSGPIQMIRTENPFVTNGLK